MKPPDRRLADEYGAAQERGEVARPSKVEGLATAGDIGLSHRNIHDARAVRDAETADPGIVRRVLDEQSPQRRAVDDRMHCLHPGR